MSNKVFSGIHDLPCGTASDTVLPGCMVLEGGAFRGLYGEGVLDALMEADINLACTVGVSAGALNGMDYVSGQIGRSARINLGYRHDSRYISMAKYFRNGGPINFEFIFYHVPGDPFDAERFMQKDKRFVAVATNVINGKPMYFDRDTCGEIFKAIQASSSMQYISRPVMVDGIPCLDGGCSVKLPYRWAMEQGYDKIVIVRTRAKDFRYPEKVSSLPYRYYHRYPGFAKTLAGCEARYNRDCDAIDRLEKEGRVFVIAPSETIPIRRMEPDMEKLGAWYYRGYEDAENAVDALRTYLRS